MEEIGKITNHKYHLFDYYGAEYAEHVIILISSAAETAIEAVHDLMFKGETVGIINVHLVPSVLSNHTNTQNAYYD